MKLEAAGFQMGFEDTGRGPGVLFLHGYPLGRKLWRPQLEQLLWTIRVLAPDLRGHGDTDAPAGPYTMARLADDVVAFLDAREAHEPVVVCGLSMGGYVALELAARHPKRVAGLMLTATRASADTPEGRAGRDSQAQLVREKGMAAVAETMLPKLFAPKNLKAQSGNVDYVRRMMLAAKPEGIVEILGGIRDRRDFLPELARLAVPTLIVHGADDVLIPKSEAEAMHRAIRGSRFELVQGAGHLPNLEQPLAFNKLVKGFVDEVFAGGASPSSSVH